MTSQPRTVRAPDGSSLDVNVNPTEVLVVGGGLAGCWAAERASERGAQVTVVDKSRVGAGGVSPFAGAVILCMGPEDDFDAFLTEQIEDGERLNDPEWIEKLYYDNWERIQQLNEWGAPMERNPDGSPHRRKVDIGARKTVHRLKWDSVEFMKFFYKRLKRQSHKRSIEMVSQTPIVRLIRRDGRVRGAIGINRQQGHLTVFPAERVVLAAGGCGFKGNHFALDSVCGEAYDMALDAGVSLAGMEFSNGYIATCRHINTHGQSVLAAIGGQYINGNHEPFLHRYTDQHPAPIPVVCRAFAREVQAGRGPIYFDLRDVDPEAVKDWKDTFYLIQRLADRKGIDLFDEPLEWHPGMAGTIGAGGGVWVDDCSMATDVPGLYVAGDAATKMPVVGAGSGITFLNLAWANTTGYWAGDAAARDLSSKQNTTNGSTLTPNEVRDELEHVLRPLSGSDGPPVDECYRTLQETVMPADISLVRSRSNLEKARARTKQMWEQTLEQVPISDLRELVKFYELRGSLRTAYTMLDSALVRTETRGWHFREDYPQRDDDRWMVWTRLSSDPKGSDGFRIDTHPAPLAGANESVGRGV